MKTIPHPNRQRIRYLYFLAVSFFLHKNQLYFMDSLVLYFLHLEFDMVPDNLTFLSVLWYLSNQIQQNPDMVS